MKLKDLLNKFQNVKKMSDGYLCICPAHDDKKQSLSVTAKDNRILLHCHAGCTPEIVCKALGLSLADLFEKTSQNGEKREISAIYPYTDERGGTLYEVVRYQPKSFVQRKPNGKGNFEYKLNGVRRVPFNLPQLLQAGKLRAVFIVEGERDVLTLCDAGLVATCNVGGAGKWKDEYSEFLRDRVCYILPDNDEPGRKHAEQVANSLYGKAKEIRIVNLPDLPEKGDVSDFLQTHTTKELKKIVQSSPLWTPHSEKAQSSQKSASKTKKQVNFARLTDGRIIEQTTQGFAVFSKDSGDISFAPFVEDADCIFEPQPLQANERGETLIGLPTDVTEYESEGELDRAIEDYLMRHIDLPDVERKLTVQYIKLTYLCDKLEELPYLRAVGERGNGKSRFIFAVGLACYRPLFVVSITAAALFRLMDAYRPTLVIDEANLNVESDDTQAIMQILNSGYQRVGKIPRVEGGQGGGVRRVEYFEPFGAKILASLKTFDSAAFESRCVKVEMQKTTRTDIRFRLSASLKREAETLRNKLILWRMRQLSRDFENELDAAETALKVAGIEPRYVQIGTPLYAVIGDEKLRQSFIAMLQRRDSADTEARQETFDGKLVSTLHKLLCDVSDGECTLRSGCAEGEPCELLTIEAITASLNEDKPEKEHFKNEYVGKRLGKLEFDRQKINARNVFRDKKAVVFDSMRFAKKFENYGLPVPKELSPFCQPPLSGEIPVATVANKNKTLQTKGLSWRQLDEKEAQEENNCRQLNDNSCNALSGVATVATGISPEKVTDTVLTDNFQSEFRSMVASFSPDALEDFQISLAEQTAILETECGLSYADAQTRAERDLLARHLETR